jgi:hypothetical protein
MTPAARDGKMLDEMSRLPIRFLALAPLLLLIGCAHYEYDLLKPEQFARHISTKADEVVTLDPLEYRLRTSDNHLVLQVFNTSDEPIELLGSQSVVVDPSGQSRPLRGQTIAPSSFAKLIFPPLRPTFETAGPTWGVGYGVSTYHRDIGFPNYDVIDPPRYYAVYDSEIYWEWNGPGDLRLTLVYRRGAEQKEIRHEFVFRRQKMS